MVLQGLLVEQTDAVDLVAKVAYFLLKCLGVGRLSLVDLAKLIILVGVYSAVSKELSADHLLEQGMPRLRASEVSLLGPT